MNKSCHYLSACASENFSVRTAGHSSIGGEAGGWTGGRAGGRCGVTVRCARKSDDSIYTEGCVRPWLPHKISSITSSATGCGGDTAFFLSASLWSEMRSRCFTINLWRLSPRLELVARELLLFWFSMWGCLCSRTDERYSKL